MLSWALLLAIPAAFLAGTVTGMTGFGLALISTPLLLFVYGPKTVIVLTAIFSIFINAAVVLDSLRDAHKRLVLALLVPALVGIFVGAEILRTVDAAYIRLAVGVVVIFSALLLLRDVRLPGAGSRWGTVVAG
ncbi:MAG: sulfite exporter TauE/SafE family protein, partial [Actinomycetota bacterium]|nr:sulfite exporter TauE/SafE family protein [Actinomycetota bacterium]